VNSLDEIQRVVVRNVLERVGNALNYIFGSDKSHTAIPSDWL
jgi:hypothetical protein